MYAIRAEGLLVEYARFCGHRCEAVGFGEPAKYDHARAVAIVAMLRANRYRGVRMVAAK